MTPLRTIGHDRSYIPVVVVAALVQAAYLIGAAVDPTFAIPIVDEATYHDAAVRFAEGLSLSDDAFWQPPLFPFLLGLLYRVTGPDVVLARILLAGLAVASCALAWWIGKELFSRRVGVAAGLMASVYGPLLFFSTKLLPTGLAVFLDLATIALWIRCLRTPTGLRWLTFGIVAGLTTLTVPNGIVLVFAGPLGALLVGLSRQRWRRSAVLVTISILGFVAVVSAVTLRNHRVSGEWVVISTNGGMNLYLGNNPDTDKTLAVRPGEGWRRLARQGFREGAWSPAQQSRYFLSKTIRYIADEPVDFLRGLFRKATRVINAQEIPRNVDPFICRDDSWVLSVLLWRVGSLGFPFGVIAPLAALGVVTLLSGKSGTLIQRAGRAGLLIFILAYGATIVVFFVSSRYRLPLAVAMLPFASAGVFAVCEWIRNPRRAPRVFMAAATLLVATLLVNWPMSVPTDEVDFRAERALCIGSVYVKAQEWSEAERYLRSALDRNPHYGDAAVVLGNALAGQGRWNEAESLFRNAMRWDVDSAEPGVDLARLLRRLDRDDEAMVILLETVERDPSSSLAHEGLGDLYASRGEWNKAVQHFEGAMPFTEHRGQLLVRLADAQVQVGSYEEAIEAYRRALLRIEPDPDTLNRVAWLLATCPTVELRNCGRAIEMAEYLCEVTEYQNAGAMDTLAASYAECGRWSDAVEWSRRAIATASQGGAASVPKGMVQRLRIYEERLERRRTGLGPNGQKPVTPP